MKWSIVLLGCAVLTASMASTVVQGQTVISDPMADLGQWGFGDVWDYMVLMPWNWGSDGLSDRLVPGSDSNRPKVTITPENPTSNDSIEVKVTCWVPASNYGVDQDDVDIVGNHINLNLHWGSSGYGFQAFTWQSHTTTLEPLTAGVYVLDVHNSGAVTESVTKTLTVRFSSGTIAFEHRLYPGTLAIIPRD